MSINVSETLSSIGCVSIVDDDDANSQLFPVTIVVSTFPDTLQFKVKHKWMEHWQLQIANMKEHFNILSTIDVIKKRPPITIMYLDISHKVHRGSCDLEFLSVDPNIDFLDNLNQFFIKRTAMGFKIKFGGVCDVELPLKGLLVVSFEIGTSDRWIPGLGLGYPKEV